MSLAFIDQLASHGERPALLADDGVSITYRELAQRIAACRAIIGETRRLILWEAESAPQAIIHYLAALAGGHPILPVAPVDPARPHLRQDLIERYRPDVIAGRQGADFGFLRQATGADETAGALHPDLALLLSTSGSTGSPKLVRLSQGNLASNAAAIAAYLDLTPTDRGALILPLHYSYGLSVLHAHLAVGASLFLHPRSVLAPGFLDEVAALGCTNLSGVPHSFDLFEQIGLCARMPETLRFMTVAGGRLAPDLVRKYAARMTARDGRFFVMYGQTEATARIAYLPPALAEAHPDCIGDAVPGGALHLVDESGATLVSEGLVGKGQAGELVYRGPNVMMGYATSRADLSRGSELAELRTGDLAERVEPGLYRIIGRRSRFSKIAGLRIAHDEIERRLAESGIEAIVVGDDRMLGIAVKPPGNAAAIRERIVALTGLPASFIRVSFPAEIPLLATGKPDYAALRVLFEDASSLPAGSAPDPVMAAFADVFAPRPVYPADSFVSLGGDSLAFLQLSLALESHLGALPEGWERRRIAELAAGAVPRHARSAHQARPARWRLGWRRLATLETDHVLRAFAIAMVVLHHATMWPLAGGAAILLMLMGHNLARFQAPRLLAGEGAAVLRATWRPVLIYYPLLLIYCLYQGVFPWQSLLLVGNWGIDGYSTMPSPITPFWFVEVYLQTILILIALFAVPALRERVQARPFASGLVFLGLSIVLRETIGYVWDAGEMNIFFTPRLLYVPAIGWCLYFAHDRARKFFMSALVVLLLVGLPYFEGPHVTILWVRAALLIGACLILAWFTRLRLPAPVARLALLLSAASFSIYLFHNLPYYLWLNDGVGGRAFAAVHVVLGLATGVALHFLMRAVGRGWRRSPMSQRISDWLPFARPGMRPGE